MRQSILFVDDSHDLLGVYFEIFSQLGVSLIRADNATEGLKKYLEHREHVAVVVTDGMMPDHSGLWLAKQVVNHDPFIPIVLVSADTDRVLKDETDRAYFSDVIRKPFSLEEMRRVLLGYLT